MTKSHVLSRRAITSPPRSVEAGPSGLFNRVPRATTLSHLAQGQIEELIVTRALGPGDRLPPERQLGEILGVSRTVVREAVRQLAAKGLVEIRTGSGVYVRQMGSDLMRAPIDLLFRAGFLPAKDIYDVRLVLEPRIAELAAENAAEQDTLKMEETLRSLRNRQLTAHDFATADVVFHTALAAASRNGWFLVLLDSMANVMTQIRLIGFASPETLEHAIRDHSIILERVKARDPAGARLAMTEHITHSYEILGSVLESKMRLKNVEK